MQKYRIKLHTECNGDGIGIQIYLVKFETKKELQANCSYRMMGDAFYLHFKTEPMTSFQKKRTPNIKCLALTFGLFRSVNDSLMSTMCVLCLFNYKNKYSRFRLTYYLLRSRLFKLNDSDEAELRHTWCEFIDFICSPFQYFARCKLNFFYRIFPSEIRIARQKRASRASSKDTGKIKKKWIVPLELETIIIILKYEFVFDCPRYQSGMIIIMFDVICFTMKLIVRKYSFQDFCFANVGMTVENDQLRLDNVMMSGIFVVFRIKSRCDFILNFNLYRI